MIERDELPRLKPPPGELTVECPKCHWQVSETCCAYQDFDYYKDCYGYITRRDRKVPVEERNRIAQSVLAAEVLAVRAERERCARIARIEQLEAALRWIADFEPEYSHHGTLNVQVVRILETARAALAPEQDK
jgi:hypothetical protein